MSDGPLASHHFLLRRLHSLTGIVPIGVYLVVHLLTNSSLAWGRFGLREGAGMTISEGGVRYYQDEVAWINSQIPHLLLVEVVLWVSIAFHTVLGFYYAATGTNNTRRYPHQDNWRYLLQRVSGYIGIIFIFYHVATLRWGWTFLVPGGTTWSHHFSVSTLAAALRGDEYGWTGPGVAVAVLYFVGITLLVFHFANGLWTAAITWGVTVSEAAQRRWGVVCLVMGAALMLGGWASLAAAVMMPYDEARAVEEQILVEEYGEARAAEIIREQEAGGGEHGGTAARAVSPAGEPEGTVRHGG